MKILKLLVILLGISCVRKTNSAINYLDQKKPGIIPEIFAPGIVSMKGRFEMGFTMSPNGASIAFGVAREANAEETCIYLMNSQMENGAIPIKQLSPTT